MEHTAIGVRMTRSRRNSGCNQSVTVTDDRNETPTEPSRPGPRRQNSRLGRGSHEKIATTRRFAIDDMKTINNAHSGRQNDAALNWTMRIVGLLVFAASAFFIHREISLSPWYDYFFAMTALLGFVTAAASWLRPAAKNQWGHEHFGPLEPVRQVSS